MIPLPTSRDILDTHRKTLWLRGCEIPLTYNEYRMLALLTRTPGRVFSRVEILDALDHAGENHVFDRAVDSLISRLRSKLEADPRTPRHLVTVRGMGYRFSW